jgi:hypothetical protein
LKWEVFVSREPCADPFNGDEPAEEHREPYGQIPGFCRLSSRPSKSCAIDNARSAFQMLICILFDVLCQLSKGTARGSYP